MSEPIRKGDLVRIVWHPPFPTPDYDSIDSSFFVEKWAANRRNSAPRLDRTAMVPRSSLEGRYATVAATPRPSSRHVRIHLLDEDGRVFVEANGRAMDSIVIDRACVRDCVLRDLIRSSRTPPRKA
jgi:hypothetical protein